MGISLAEAACRFFNHCCMAKTLSQHTLRAYDADLSHAVTRLGKDTLVSGIDRDDLRKYVGTMLQNEGLKETSVKRRMTTVRQLFKWLGPVDKLAHPQFD